MYSIIVKDRRDTQFGHKLNLTTGKHGMVLDVVIEAGNPADSSRMVRTMCPPICVCVPNTI